MSAFLHELPFPPERALTRPSQFPVSEGTGFEPATIPNKKLLKSRERTQVLQGFVSEATEVSRNSHFAYSEEKAEKQKDASCVFLLWGSRDSENYPTWAVDVQITGVEGEDEIFRQLAQRYSDVRGYLQKYFSFREYDKVEPVTFRIIRRCSDKFSVIMEHLDLTEYRKIYSARREKAGAEIATIADFSADPFADICYRDCAGKYEHDNGQCPVNVNSSQVLGEPKCPFKEWDVCNDELKWIDTAGFLSCYFRDPDGAQSQRMLHGFGPHRYIHHYRNVGSPPNRFRPQTRDSSFDGLYLRTRVNIGRGICTCVGLIVLVISGGKLIWNSWEIVFGAGGFFVAVPMLAMTAITFCGA